MSGCFQWAEMTNEYSERLSFVLLKVATRLVTIIYMHPNTVWQAQLAKASDFVGRTFSGD